MHCRKCTVWVFATLIMVGNNACHGEGGESVVASGAHLQKLCGLYHNAIGRSKTEGPVADRKGNVYFTDPYGAVIYRWNAGEGVGIFTDDSGGANGLFLDAGGNIVAVRHTAAGLPYSARTALIRWLPTHTRESG